VAIRLSIPGKSFLAGEYLALSGGPALLFMSEPRFEIIAQAGTGQLIGIHPESPAGKLWTANKDFFQNFDLIFKDGYKGQGGFGASTAQFLAVYALNAWQESVYHEPQKLLDYKHLLETYWQHAWNGEGTRPSGADLIGQLKGALTIFERASGKIAIQGWPFENLDFVLAHTGNKVPTHEHLKSLGEFPTEGLFKAFQQIEKGLNEHSEANLLNGVHHYAEVLRGLGFTCEPTLKLLSDVHSIPGVKAAKGCGALGADVLFIIFEKSQTASVVEAIEKKGLKIVTKRSQVGAGLEVQTI
jgi:Mevalonate kinase